MKEFLHNKWFTFSWITVCYLLWVIWLQNFWWLLGVGIIFDMYITKKVPWAFWKKIEGKNKFQKAILSWVDAIIFAVIAASFIRLFFFEAYTIPTPSMEGSLLVGDFLFVSKCHYGPRTPMTPISFPFVHHSMPLSNNTKKSFSEVWKRPYNRLAGFQTIKNNDIVVFNFPEGDTVILTRQAESFYQIKRDFAQNMFSLNVPNERRFIQLAQELGGVEPAFYEFFKDSIVYRPVDKRENYIKRCVAIPGDTLVIRDGHVYINGVREKDFDGKQFQYIIEVEGRTITRMPELGIRTYESMPYGYFAVLNQKQFELLSSFQVVKNIHRHRKGVDGLYNDRCFPHHPNFPWNKDFFGPFVLPKAGVTIPLTVFNLPLYQRIITVYEGNSLRVENDNIFINNELVHEYTFALDYYWLMGDNRDNSQDSRFWGPVPNDHVVGKAILIWLSLEGNRPFPFNIRWSRLFSSIHKN